MIHSFLEWLGNTGWSIALIESLYMWPIVLGVHLMGMAAFVGLILTMDLRLGGVGFRNVPASGFIDRALPWAKAAFAVAVVTGLLLFYSSPIRYYYNFFFRVKMFIIVLAALNVWFFHSRIGRRIAEWDMDRVPPRAARVAGLVSIIAWAAVIVTGRFIAYNWFDCDMQPQPAFVNWVAGCRIDVE